MAKPQSKNGSWRLSRSVWQEQMPDLPFLMGVGGPPFRLTFTLSADRNIRGRYLYPHPGKIVAYEGDWIIHINGWICVINC